MWPYAVLSQDQYSVHVVVLSICMDRSLSFFNLVKFWLMYRFFFSLQRQLFKSVLSVMEEGSTNMDNTAEKYKQ